MANSFVELLFLGSLDGCYGNEFDNAEQKKIQKMIERKSNNIPEPRYYKDKNGNIAWDGNIQVE